MLRRLKICIRSALTIFCILGAGLILTACAELQEEFDSSKWRYRPVPNMPPSWENDVGVPPLGYEGETPFN